MSKPDGVVYITYGLPVLPLVGSMTTLLPGTKTPSFSASSTIRFATRSLTEPPTEKNSTFATNGDLSIQQSTIDKRGYYTYVDCISILPLSQVYLDGSEVSSL